MEQDIINTLDALIESYREDIITATRRLVAHNSEFEENGGPGEPFGHSIAVALEDTLALGRELGFATRNVDGYMGEIDLGDPGKGDKIGIITHIDIVPAGDGWTYPPFEGKIVDGRLYGRGSVDDKGPLAASLYAMKAIAESGLPLKNHARLLIGADEESGFRCIRYYLEKETPPVCGFSPDAEFPVIYGEKGTYRYKATGAWQPDDTEGLRVVSIQGGTRMNVVPEYARAELKGDAVLTAKAKAALEGYKEKEHITLSVNGDTLLIEARGVGTHAATPWFGLSANNLLLRFLRQLPLAPAGAQKYVYALADLFSEGNSGEGLGIACNDEELGPLTLSLGVLAVDSQKGSASFDMRYPNLDAHDSLWQTITTTCQAHGLEMELLQDKPGIYIPKGSFLIRSLLEAYRLASGRDEPPVTIGGGTYSRALKNFAGYGPVFPGQRELAHERDEYITVDDLMLCAKIYAYALYNLLK